MIMRNPASGELVVNLSREEFLELYADWQQKPEAKAMFDMLVAERRIMVQRILGDIKARKAR